MGRFGVRGGVLVLGLAGTALAGCTTAPAGARLDLGGDASSTARDVSDSGWIVGNLLRPGDTANRAFRVDPSGAVTTLGEGTIADAPGLTAVNDLGDAVGSALRLDAQRNPVPRGLRWSASGARTDGPGEQSMLTGIDGVGTTIGRVRTATGIRPFVWPAGGTIRYLLPEQDGGPVDDAVALNDRGDVLGLVEGAAPTPALLWEAGAARPRRLPILLDGSAHGGLNHGRDVAGVMMVGGRTRAALLRGATGEPVELPGGTGASGATDVNERGDVVGWIEVADGRRHAAYWAGDTLAFTDLGVLDGVASEAVALNDTGTIVGNVTDADTDYQHAARFAAPAR